MSRNYKSKNRNNSYRPNFYGMLQNVLIAALNKGQLLGMAFALVFILLVLKYPSDEIPNLVDKIFDLSNFNKVLGWVIGIISTSSAYLVTRWQRRIHTKEIRRISQEKKELQEELTQLKLPSSNRQN